MHENIMRFSSEFMLQKYSKHYTLAFYRAENYVQFYFHGILVVSISNAIIPANAGKCWFRSFFPSDLRISSIIVRNIVVHNFLVKHKPYISSPLIYLKRNSESL